MLGTELDVPTLDGQVRVKVPAGTQTGSILRLGGKGLPELGGGHRGSLNVVLAVRIPEHPSPEERELYERIRSSSAPPSRSSDAGRRRAHE